DARAQTMWSFCLTLSGLTVGLCAPFLGALADTTGRRTPWVAVCSVVYILGASALWLTNPDGSNLTFALLAFGLGFVGAEFALIFTNAQLPSLTSREEVGRVSGSGFAFGYLGGVIALVFVLGLLVEQDSGRTLLGLKPLFGILDADTKQGVRAAGPFVAIWFAIFMVPYFLWVREPKTTAAQPSIRKALSQLWSTVTSLKTRPSLASFLGGSMLYRDALNGLYGYGGTYGLLVLNWSITKVGIFGIVSAISAVVLSWLGGQLDKRFGPKPIAIAAGLCLILVCITIVNMTRDSFFGVALAEGSSLPDTVFFVCGILIGGLGGILQAASRTLMVRHTDAGAETEGFGLYGFSGRATAFLAPALITAVIAATGDVRNGVIPLIALFILGLLLLRWTNAEGDRAA
ncbi:MAG: MFS transporter, partial [Pseudomonadota bacterium]